MSTPARYRGARAENEASKPSNDVAGDATKKAEKSASGGRWISLVDVLRIVVAILGVVIATSYLSTNGESMTWYYNPWWTRAREWKALFKGEVRLTDEELVAFDGSDPTKPIYLALEGNIYDVSSNRGTYGPGGSYHFFAGRDAARAFLTGCFQEDQTPDLRGVEYMFLPVEPEPGSEEAEKLKPLSKGEIKNRHAKELREARKKVKEGLEHWHKLFRGDKGKPYHKVGEVVREEGWLEKLPKRDLCDYAQKSRPVRKPEEKA